MWTTCASPLGEVLRGTPEGVARKRVLLALEGAPLPGARALS